MFDLIYKFPLSGDVKQDIETDFFKDNIKDNQKQEIEKKIFKDIASYGSQLGTIIDCLYELTINEDSEIINKLRLLKTEIELIKANVNNDNI